jgi:molecular chaperone GrpE
MIPREEDPGKDPSEIEPAASGEADSPGATEAASEESKRLKSELDATRDRWLRAEAELQNYRRRAMRDVEEARRAAENRLLLETLDQLDDLERAIDQAKSDAPPSWLEGVRLVAGRMIESLGREGVRGIEAVGQPFDPDKHEALLEAETDEVPPGHVVQVVRRGWMREGRTLRAARVVVARRTADAAAG